MGGYLKRCMGINLYFKVENPNGHRIQELFVRGKKLQMDNAYKVAYVTTQGVPLNYGRNREQLNFSAVENLKKYLSDNKQVKSELQGTVIAV